MYWVEYEKKLFYLPKESNVPRNVKSTHTHNFKPRDTLMSPKFNWLNYLRTLPFAEAQIWN